MKKILFVDDEPKILEGVRRMLRGRRKDWDMRFVEGGAQALECLENEEFQVLLSDMRMPGMDGATLLEKARQISPATVRIILSGHTDQLNIMRTVRPAHQYLNKPIEQEALEAVIENSLSLHEILSEPALTALLSQVENLPALPRLFQELLAEMDSEDCSLQKVGNLIGQDMGMTTTILKVVNSAFFGLPRRVSDPNQAVTLLGTETIKALVLSYQLFSACDMTTRQLFSLDCLWRHSVTTAGFVKAIAQLEGWDRERVEEAFLTGMLHDVGKLTLRCVAAERYSTVMEQVRRGEGMVCQQERRMFHTTHAEAGAYLLGLWGFSGEVIRAIATHHQTEANPGQGADLATILKVANVLEHQLVVIHPSYQVPQLDMELLEAVGVTKRLGAWRRACEQIVGEGEADATGSLA